VAQPLTFMNLSGEAVVKLLNYYDLTPEQLLVVYDDAALPFGRLRIRPGGSDAGQKGMKSIIAQLGGNNQVPRLRIGIGGPPAQMAMPNFVLSKFDPEEQKDLPRIIATSIECVETWLDSGMEKAMERYNGLILAGQETG
jgi:PTH1 family peptidyl-tRNA hydrolase